jgi:hypothetical protein
MSVLLFAVLSVLSADEPPNALDQATGSALILAAQFGLPPEHIRAIFGDPDFSHRGRSDWRTNPDRYLFWGYSQYAVSIEWEASPFPRTGNGFKLRIMGP